MAKQLRRTRIISFRIGAYRFHIEKHTWFYPQHEVPKAFSDEALKVKRAGEIINKSLKNGYKAGRK